MSDSSDATIVITREYPFPAERVYDAWLDPALAGRFLFATPTGVMIRAETDPRVGGGFVFTDRRGDQDVEHVGKYLELERPRRIVFEFQVTGTGGPPAAVAIDIAPDGVDRCVLTLTQHLDPSWIEFKSRAEAGWRGICEGLARALS